MSTFIHNLIGQLKWHGNFEFKKILTNKISIRGIPKINIKLTLEVQIFNNTRGQAPCALKRANPFRSYCMFNHSKTVA